MVKNVSIRCPKIVANFHFWVVVILFAAGIMLHYPQQILSTSSPSLFSFLGLTRHAIERIFLLLPIGYASFYLGTRAGLASLAVAAAVMLPRVFLISEYFPDALFETVEVIIIGGLINLWFVRYRNEKEQRQQMLSNLEASNRQLQSHTSALEISQQRLVTINQISNTISQSLELSQILDNAINSVIGLMQVDAAWIYLLNQENNELVLAAHRGYSEGANRIKVGYDISGRVVESGQPVIVDDVPREAGLPEELQQRMNSVVVVPLSAKTKVKGTLGVNSRRQFEKGEIDLLTIIGNQIGIAVDNAGLYQTQKEMQDKLSSAYRELSESHQRLKESQEQLIQAEKLISLGQLSASIAHEVNNPLSGVLVYTQLLVKKIRGGEIDKEVALNYLSKMEFELTRSTKLIRNLLDFARQSPPEFHEVSLNVVLNQAFDLVAHSAETQHIQMVKELDPALPGIMADSNQLQQVCTNIIMNAIQAMPQGGKLALRTSFHNNQVRVEVQDTGRGIPPENMSKLFTPFFTTKSEVKGVGLGLAVAYGIVQRHKGKIEVQSKLGEGTTFTVHLPLHLDLVGTQ